MEPENKELRKQYIEAKETYEKVSFPLCSLSQSVFVFVHIQFDDSTRTFMTVALFSPFGANTHITLRHM